MAVLEQRGPQVQARVSGRLQQPRGQALENSVHQEAVHPSVDELSRRREDTGEFLVKQESPRLKIDPDRLLPTLEVPWFSSTAFVCSLAMEPAISSLEANKSSLSSIISQLSEELRCPRSLRQMSSRPNFCTRGISGSQRRPSRRRRACARRRLAARRRR